MALTHSVCVRIVVGRLILEVMEDILKDTHVEYIKKWISQMLFNLELLDKSISTAGLQNEQFILDFYDKLNEISVRK